MCSRSESPVYILSQCKSVQSSIQQACEDVFIPAFHSHHQPCMQVEVRRFWAGALVEQVPIVDVLLLLRIAAQDIVHEDLFASTAFMCL